MQGNFMGRNETWKITWIRGELRQDLINEKTISWELQL